MLRGPRIKLGPIKREYIDSFLKWFNDPEITQYLMMYLPMTRMAEEDWIENLREDNNNIHFSIVIFLEEKSEKLIGKIELLKRELLLEKKSIIIRDMEQKR